MQDDTKISCAAAAHIMKGLAGWMDARLPTTQYIYDDCNRNPLYTYRKKPQGKEREKEDVE